MMMVIIIVVVVVVDDDDIIIIAIIIIIIIIITGECDVTNGYALLGNLRFCVKVFSGDKTFYDANDTCSKSGDRLVVFDTTEKTMALNTYLAHSGE